MKNYKRRPTSRQLNKVVNSFTVYKFIKALTTNFRDTDAYRLGVIDAKGKYLKNPDTHISVFDRLIINLKVLLAMIPNPAIKAKLSYLTTGISVLAEEYGENPDEVKKEIEDYMNLILLEEAPEKPKIETTLHMTHVGDWSYTPHGSHKDETEVDPHLGLKHMEAMHNWMNGKETAGHRVDIKADGSLSLRIGRVHHTPEDAHKKGTRVVGYKSGALYTKKELEKLDKPWAADALKVLHHTRDMPIKVGHVFQGDLLWAGRSQKGTAKPNTIEYKSTHHELGIAFHGHFKHNEITNDQIKLDGVDHSQLSSASTHSPKLQLQLGSVRLTAPRNIAIAAAIRRAKVALTPETAEYAKNIHKDKHFAKFFQEYSNEVVATTGKRSVSSMLKYIHTPLAKVQTSRAYINKPTQAKLSDSRRSNVIDGITTHILQNKKHLKALLAHQQHLTTAKHHMLDALKDHQGSHPLSPIEGEEHEGFVSVIGRSMAKLTREGLAGFSGRNRANSLIRFTPVQEEMSAGAMTTSSGAITGVTPGKPEDTIVKPRSRRIKLAKKIWSRLKIKS